MQRKLNISDEKIVDLRVKIEELKLEKEKEWLSISSKILFSIIAFSLTLNFAWEFLRDSLVKVLVLVIIFINKLISPNIALILTIVVLIVTLWLSAYLGSWLGEKVIGTYEQEHKKIYDNRINELEKLVNECQK